MRWNLEGSGTQGISGGYHITELTLRSSHFYQRELIPVEWRSILTPGGRQPPPGGWQPYMDQNFDPPPATSTALLHMNGIFSSIEYPCVAQFKNDSTMAIGDIVRTSIIIPSSWRDPSLHESVIMFAAVSLLSGFLSLTTKFLNLLFSQFLESALFGNALSECTSLPEIGS